MTSIQDELATLTPDERSSAPREWCPNGSGMMVRVISPTYLRARIASRELDRRGEDLPDQVYRAAVKAMTVPCCHRATMTIRAHVMTIAAAHGFTFKEITARNRLTEISVARQEIMWTLRHVHGLTFPQIAAYVNRSDHTTVVHGVSMHQKRLDGEVGQPRKALSHDAVYDLTERGWSIAAIARHLRVSRLRVASIRAKAA